MFARFCLYGFLKNQRYFEPFLILIFLDRHLSFALIGLLIAAREATTNALEILSGALADTWGRRRSMITSFVAYISSILLLATAHDDLPLLFLAMILYGVGEAFRSGTHKAMILTWLRAQGREEERTEVYGKTRSWSKFGSALSVLVGCTLVFFHGTLDTLFWLTLVPYTLLLINLASYPDTLEGEQQQDVLSMKIIWAHMRDTIEEIKASRPLQYLLLESSAFMGGFKTTKDYLQPILQAMALASMASALTGQKPDTLEVAKRTALFIGPVYFTLFLLAAFMSRRAKKLVKRMGDEHRASERLWWIFTSCFALMLLLSLTDVKLLLIPGFILLYALESMWRPLALSRFDTHGSEHQGATLLSIESQARSITTMILAPTLGLLIDWTLSTQQPPWWPVMLTGLFLGLFGLYLCKTTKISPALLSQDT